MTYTISTWKDFGRGGPPSSISRTVTINPLAAAKAARDASESSAIPIGIKFRHTSDVSRKRELPIATLSRASERSGVDFEPDLKSSAPKVSKVPLNRLNAMTLALQNIRKWLFLFIFDPPVLDEICPIDLLRT